MQLQVLTIFPQLRLVNRALPGHKTTMEFGSFFSFTHFDIYFVHSYFLLANRASGEKLLRKSVSSFLFLMYSPFAGEQGIGRKNLPDESGSFQPL
jgi:hypothetical protein